MSLRPSITRSPVACSGDMYCGVPSERPVCVMRAPPAFEIASAMPKSATTGCPSLEQNVLGLEVAVDHAVRVRVVERAGDGDRDADRFVDRQLLLALEPRAERLALDVRHHIEEQPVGVARVEQRQQVRVLEVRGDLDLAEEPLDAEHGAELRIEHLERDVAIVLEVAREIDGRHAAAPDLALENVRGSKGFLELREEVAHQLAREGADPDGARGVDARAFNKDKSSCLFPLGERAAVIVHDLALDVPQLVGQHGNLFVEVTPNQRLTVTTAVQEA